MPAVIEIEGLTKYYGDVRGVEGIDLRVEAGEVFGFLGPNGAGKTTTIRLLLDLIRPTAGRMRILGLDPRADGVALHRRLGYLPGDLALYERRTGGQILRHFSALRRDGGRCAHGPACQSTPPRPRPADPRRRFAIEKFAAVFVVATAVRALDVAILVVVTVVSVVAGLIAFDRRDLAVWVHWHADPARALGCLLDRHRRGAPRAP